MLRGLVIRQGLILVDLCLAMLILGVAYLAVARVFEEQERLISTGDDTALRTGATNTPRAPRDRTAYDPIIAGRLYGPAGDTPREAPPPPGPSNGDLVETELYLRLLGTAASHPTDPLGTAVIENGTTKRVDTYYIRQAVMENVVLDQIHKGWVVLHNLTTNNREILRAEEGTPPAQPATTARGPRPPTGRSSTSSRPTSPNQVIVRRNELIQELSQVNYAELYGQINPEVAQDESGNVLGLTSKNIGKVPLAQKYGFKDGDIIQMINGQRISSVENAIEVVNRFQTAPTFWVSILRDGRPQMLVFRVE